MTFCRRLTPFLCAVLVHGLALAAEPATPPYKAHWPEGWDVESHPTPSQKPGSGRVRVQRQENGKLAAAIELVYFRRPAGKMSLDTDFAGVVKGLQEGYEAKGLTPKVAGPRATTLASHPAQEVESAVTGRGVALHQLYGMALTAKYVYTLTYTAQDAHYERYREAFEKARQSLELP